MMEQMQYVEAVTHFIESGENMQAVQAAIHGRQWSRALEILESQDDDTNPDVTKHYQQLGEFKNRLNLHMFDNTLSFSSSFCSKSRI